MALDKDRLAASVAQKLVDAGLVAEEKKDETAAIWVYIADAFIEEIKDNAEVSTDVTGTNNPATNEVTGTGTGSIE